jgi:hypothetical protein
MFGLRARKNKIRITIIIRKIILLSASFITALQPIITISNQSTQAALTRNRRRTAEIVSPSRRRTSTTYPTASARCNESIIDFQICTVLAELGMASWLRFQWVEAAKFDWLNGQDCCRHCTWRYRLPSSTDCSRSWQLPQLPNSTGRLRSSSPR